LVRILVITTKSLGKAIVNLSVRGLELLLN